VKLNGPLAFLGNVVDLRVTADGARVVYLADANANNRFELFSVPVDGSQAPIQLNHPLASGGDVLIFEATPDGAQVLFVADDGGTKLFSVPVVGGEAPLQLSPAGLVIDTASGLRIGPDGARVVFRTFLDLFSAPTDGSHAARKLNTVFGRSVSGSISGVLDGSSFEISPDGSRVVYVMDSKVSQRYQLYSVPIDGPGHGTSVRLNGQLPTSGDVREFAISPNGARVVYYADQEADGRFELFSVPIEGVRNVQRSDGSSHSGRVKLNGPLAPGGIVGEGFAISPDGSRVLFAAQTIDTSHRDLFNAPIDGGDGSASPTALTTGHVDVGDFRFSPDGERVVYFALTTASGLYSTLADGSAPAIGLFLLPPIWTGAYRPYSISPDGAWVVYRSDVDEEDEFELYARPIDGSQPAVQLSGPLTTEGDVGGADGDSLSPVMLVTPDSSHVLYGADQDLDEVFELFASPLP